MRKPKNPFLVGFIRRRSGFIKRSFLFLFLSFSRVNLRLPFSNRFLFWFSPHDNWKSLVGLRSYYTENNLPAKKIFFKEENVGPEIKRWKLFSIARVPKIFYFNEDLSIYLSALFNGRRSFSHFSSLLRRLK